MTKQLFLAFLVGLMAIILNPTALTASDYFQIRQPDYAALGDLVAQQNAAASTSEQKPEATNTSWDGAIKETLLPRNAATPALSVPAAGTYTQTYQITHLISDVAEYNSISAAPSYTDIYRFKKLVFGHNTNQLLGTLANLTPGQAISVTENGQTTAYMVITTELVPKVGNYLNGDPEFINKLAYRAGGHSLAFLTCAGTMYGNGDASHRLIVYLDAI